MNADWECPAPREAKRMFIPRRGIGTRDRMPEPPKADVSKPVSVDDRIGLDKFEFDEKPFITVDTDVCRTCDAKPCLYVCPAKVYRLDKGELVYNVEGCIEMGACVVVCEHIGRGAIRWNYPRGSYGVEFRFG